jgi:predicted phage-related endonuclease
VTNDKWGFSLGMSPDGLVGEDGGIQVKSRRHKFQVKTIVLDELPPEFVIQVQTELMVTEREWWDFPSFSAGMNMYTKRVHRDEKIISAIEKAAKIFHDKMDVAMATYKARLSDPTFRIVPVDRKEDGDMYV